MSKAFVIRYEMRPETAEENQKLIENTFAELAQTCPEGLSYAAFRLGDGVTFVHVGVMPEGSNPLMESAAFQEFQRAFGERAASGPIASDAVLVGSYGFVR